MENVKEPYEPAKMEVIELDGKDVITASCSDGDMTTNPATIFGS